MDCILRTLGAAGYKPTVARMQARLAAAADFYHGGGGVPFVSVIVCNSIRIRSLYASFLAIYIFPRNETVSEQLMGIFPGHVSSNQLNGPRIFGGVKLILLSTRVFS